MGILFSPFSSSFSPPAPPASSIDSLSDEEVYALIEGTDKTRSTCLNFPPDGNFFHLLTPSVWRISADAVVKEQDSPTAYDAYMIDFVQSRTSILTPKVRRVLPVRDAVRGGQWWIVMDYIDGRTLKLAWPMMSWWHRLRTVWTLRRYIQQLRRLSLPLPDKPGPFDGTDNALRCQGMYFSEDGAGPFASFKEMAAWYDYKRYCLQAFFHEQYGRRWSCPKFDMSHPLVLCHNDLTMGNIMVDRTNKIWLIDWGFAGAAPPWFEYAHLAGWETAAIPQDRPPKSWQFFFRFIAGNYRSYFKDYLGRLVPLIDSYPAIHYEDGYFEGIGLSPD
ncbi:kinase-like protein [Hygrophoropsis aurantiaca]|uniref:Kinase-like protein n=1 Tax=Hygrophoropsis aurantiaca TaxID=72124 RepID=A0ACB7ZQ26_9AGAM|nr:kinase-like protein [Hygrophoropsis aurantiaca]